MMGSNGAGDADALRDEIRRTRIELGETVEALAAKADVKARLKESAGQARERMREQATQKFALVRGQAMQRAGAARGSTTGSGQSLRRSPVPWATVAAGALAAVVLMLVAQRRRR